MRRTSIPMTVEKVVSVKTEIVLDGEAIRALLAATGHKVPPEASVKFSVPFGGDWSGCSVDVDADTPITVVWTVETRSVDGETQ